MRLGRVLSVPVIAAVLASAGGAASQPARQPTADPADPALRSTYSQHMTNGNRLFKSGDYRAALKEFEAAYAASPNANPLINQALCYQKLSKYPAAVERLELALSKHKDTMGAEDEAASKRAVEEMRALFAYATIVVGPADANVSIDGDPVPREALAGPIPLSPGDHEIQVAAPGHTTKVERISVASGEKKEVKVDLVAEIGTLTVIAARKTTPIEIDGTIMGQGTWKGPLKAGTHEVRAVGESGVGRVEIAAGASLTLDLTDGKASPLPPIPPAPDKPKGPEQPTGPKAGFYGSVNGAILFPTRNPQYFSEIASIEGLSSGGFVGLRPGYRVHTYAGFEGIVEYGNIQGPGDASDDESFSLSLLRFGPVLRLMSPGDTIRFLGTVGGGLSVAFMSYDGLGPTVCPQLDSETCASVGVDFFAMTEVGFEIDIDRVLIGFAAALYLQGTKGFNDFDDGGNATDRAIGEPYENNVLPMIGPRIHIGYGFW